MITVNMTKARDIHRDKLRELRGPLIAALDVQMFRAIEQADETQKSAIAKQKQMLRDVTKAPEIEQAKTPEQLKAVMPAALIA